MSEDLRQKIIDIICEEWPTPDGYVLGADIYERLRSQGVEVTHHAVNAALSGLAEETRRLRQGVHKYRRQEAMVRRNPEREAAILVEKLKKEQASD